MKGIDRRIIKHLLHSVKCLPDFNSIGRIAVPQFGQKDTNNVQQEYQVYLKKRNNVEFVYNLNDT